MLRNIFGAGAERETQRSRSVFMWMLADSAVSTLWHSSGVFVINIGRCVLHMWYSVTVGVAKCENLREFHHEPLTWALPLWTKFATVKNPLRLNLNFVPLFLFSFICVSQVVFTRMMKISFNVIWVIQLCICLAVTSSWWFFINKLKSLTFLCFKQPELKILL